MAVNIGLRGRFYDEFLEEGTSWPLPITTGLSNTCLLGLIQISTRYKKHKNSNPSSKNAIWIQIGLD